MEITVDDIREAANFWEVYIDTPDRLHTIGTDIEPYVNLTEKEIIKAMVGGVCWAGGEGTLYDIYHYHLKLKSYYPEPYKFFKEIIELAMPEFKDKDDIIIPIYMDYLFGWLITSKLPERVLKIKKLLGEYPYPDR